MTFALSALEVTAGRPLTFNDFLALGAVSDPEISPDGQWVAFVLTRYSLEKNSSNSDIWLVPLSGGPARQLTRSPASDNQPRWAPDGRLAFVSGRSGSPQIYLIDVRGGEAQRLSNLKTGVANLAWSPDGQSLAFSADLAWPPRQEKERYASSARIFTHLFYRHWNEWRAGVRSHIFLLPLRGGAPRDLTPADHDFPTLALGGFHDLAFTPEGKLLVVANLDPVPALGTNNDILLLDPATGDTSNLTAANRANDNNPLLGPDGRWMAYRAQKRAGFESDRYHLMLRDRHAGTLRDLTPDWSLSVGEIAWAGDSSALLATVDEQGRNVVYSIPVDGGTPRRILPEGHHQALRITPDGKTLVYTLERSNQPKDVFAFDLERNRERRLSDVNRPLLSELEMNALEPFWFEGALGERVEGFLLKPPHFDPSHRYPLVYLIHGGPQGAWQDRFHPRWNTQMFAAPGYLVAMVNFHGSTGYGQAFTDSISRHWGDYPYQDVMKGLDYVLEHYPFVDPERVAAAGASYGGYMIDWIATHTDRFRCLVSHDGVYDLESMYGTTEELWFPEWEMGGTPWADPELFHKWSPHRYAGHLKTPMLVVHGQLDYRVDISQGLELFTALRRQKVPARFLYFPDEGHFVVHPRNRRLWWKEVLGWLARYLKP